MIRRSFPVLLLALSACGATSGGARHVFHPAAIAPATRPPEPAIVDEEAAVFGLRVPILVYHRLGAPHRPNPELWVDPQRFRDQMTALARSGVAVLDVDQVFMAVRHHWRYPHGAVAMTFDDASEDQYAIAFPVLQHLRLHATFFVPTDRVGDPGWLTWRQIAEMHHSGLIEFGAHTLTHADLPLLDEASAAREIELSKRVLEKRLHVVIRSFAYPFGHFDRSVEQIVRDAGFDAGVTVRFHLVHVANEALVWGRLEVPERLRPAALVRLARSCGLIGAEPARPLAGTL